MEMTSANNQQMAQSLHQNGLIQEQQEQAQYDKELKQAFEEYDNGLGDVDRLDNSLYLAQTMPRYEDDESDYNSSSDENILYEPFYHGPVRPSSITITNSLGLKTMDGVENYWAKKALKRELATARWTATCAHRQSQVDTQFMADLPKLSSINRERLSVKDKLIKDEAAAHLKALRIQAEIARKKPFVQQHRGGRRGKGPVVVVNKQADAKAEKVLEERRAKKRVEKKELKKVQASKISPDLPSGWTTHKNESHVIYISPSGKTQLQHPLSVSRVVIQIVVPEPKVVSEERAAEILEEEAQQHKAIALVRERFENEAVQEAAEAIRAERENEELDYDFSVFLKKTNKSDKVAIVAAVAPNLKVKNVIVLGAQSYTERANEAPHVTRQGMCTKRLCYSIPKGTGCQRGDHCRCAHTEGELDKEGIKCTYGARCGCIGVALRPGRKECYFWHPDLESWTQYLVRTKLAKPEPVKEVVPQVFNFPELPVAPKPVIRQVVQASSWACAAGAEAEDVTQVDEDTVVVVSKIDRKPTLLPTVVRKSSWAAAVRGFEVESKPEQEQPKIRARRSWWDVKVMPAGHWTEHLATRIVDQPVEKKSCMAPITNPWNQSVVTTKNLPPGDLEKLKSVAIWDKVEKKRPTIRSGRKTGWDVQRNYRKTRWDSENPILVNTNTVRMTEKNGAAQFSQAMAEGKMNFRTQVV
jgi:hypothetical protein